jgi:cytochrome c biogenesis protein CcmG/thiol:disulfide interchange protein DsbE
MNRFAIPLVVFGLLVALFAVGLKRLPEEGVIVIPSALIGKPAPEFTLPDLLHPGEEITSTAFKGQWVLINMWATWCAPCLVEHPVLVDIAREGKVTLLGVNYMDDDDIAREWLAELGNPYAAVVTDKKGDTAINYGLYGAPESFLVDPQGLIVHKVVGGVTASAWRDTLLPLIEGSP